MEAFQLLLQGSNVFSLTLQDGTTYGTTFSTQFKGRGDGCQGLVNGLNFDLISKSVSAPPDPLSETGKDDGLGKGGLVGKGGS